MNSKTCLSSGIKALMMASCMILMGCDKTTSPEVKDDLSLLRVAERFKESGDYASAAAFYKQAVDKDPERVELLLFLAEAEWHTTEYAQAMMHITTYLQKHPTSQEALRLKGKILLAQGATDEALVLFQKLASEYPKEASYLNYVGVCYDAKSDHKKAQSYYEKALAISGDNVGILSNLGLSLVLEGDYKRAKEVLEKALTLPGVTVRERHNLALAYGMSGDLERAEHIFRIDLDEATTRRNIDRLSSMTGKSPAAPLAHVDAPVSLDGTEDEELILQDVPFAQSSSSSKMSKKNKVQKAEPKTTKQNKKSSEDMKTLKTKENNLQKDLRPTFQDVTPDEVIVQEELRPEEKKKVTFHKPPQEK
ncbi:MAG: tetratricopeptide repeat protein [Alphaproteobacteria bacterium]|jgi:Flp pilus assembly protein TadD